MEDLYKILGVSPAATDKEIFYHGLKLEFME